MDDSMEELLLEIKEAMEKMPNDPEGLAGWLLSNYQLRKVGTGEPVTGFYGSNNTRQEPVEGVLKVAPNRIQDFYKRAGVKPKQMQS